MPPERLGGYLTELRALLDEHGMQAVSYGHYGEGCIHLRVGFGLTDTGGGERYRAFMSDAADLVVRHGGSLSGEHGDGRSRGPLLERQFSPEMIDAFAAFRRLWDPTGTLNPAIIVDPAPITEGLRPTAPTLLETVTRQAFSEDGGDFRAAVDRCIGIGRCVSTQGSTLMCPSFRATRDERHSTRGRARLLQEMMAGCLAHDGWGSRRCSRPWTSASPAAAASRSAPPASTWPPTSPSSSTITTGGAFARCRTTRWAGCRCG